MSTNENDCWTLLSYQKGQVGCFLEHLKVATELAANDPLSMLMLSGGQTRISAGPRSESASYLDALELLNHPNLPTLQNRIYTEDYARDSLQNLLFSLCRFHQITSTFPAKISMVGFPFKARRFRELHAKEVLRGLKVEFEYVAVECEGAEEAEDDAYPAFQSDPKGCGADLLKKRILRNPFSQLHPYTSCPHPLISSSCHYKV